MSTPRVVTKRHTSSDNDQSGSPSYIHVEVGTDINGYNFRVYEQKEFRTKGTDFASVQARDWQRAAEARVNAELDKRSR